MFLIGVSSEKGKHQSTACATLGSFFEGFSGMAKNEIDERILFEWRWILHPADIPLMLR
jgi:hypothetical protein